MPDQLSAEQRAAWVRLCLCQTAEEWANNLSLASNSDFNTMGESIWLFMDWAGNDPANEWERDQLASRYAILRQLKIPRELVARSPGTPPSSREFLASDDVGEIIRGLLETTEEAIQCDRDWGSSDEGRSLVLERYGADSVDNAAHAHSARAQAEGRATLEMDEDQWAVDRLRHSYEAAINASALLASSIVERETIWRAGLQRYFSGRRPA